MNTITENVDVVVVGAGHAGCEAALACARLGLKTQLFTVSVESIAMMPCNPNIGGTSKGHLVRELDALGGEMGKNIDKTFIQSKMLNQSKGPAVHSLRAQADKAEYSKEMRKVLENTENLTIRQQEVTEILTDEDGKLTGVKTYSGAVYNCKTCILYRNLPESQMHLWRCEHLHGTQRPAGSELSHGFPEGSRHRDATV